MDYLLGIANEQKTEALLAPVLTAFAQALEDAQVAGEHLGYGATQE